MIIYRVFKNSDAEEVASLVKIEKLKVILLTMLVFDHYHCKQSL